MAAQQTNAQDFNPNSLNLTRVASYDRVIQAPLVRVWENVLDWEHLPWLHRTSFDYIAVDEAGDWGWRTWSNADHTDHIELTVASADSYVARSYRDGTQFSEIWTTLTRLDQATEATEVHVEFHMADVAPDSADKLGELMVGLYTILWDEDEAMMVERHRRLIEQRNDTQEVELGEEAALRAALAAGETKVFQLNRREFQLRDVGGELIAHHTICPHLLGPLTDADIANGELTCPWHGYRFDMHTGECVSPGHATCRLRGTATVTVEEGRVIARVT